MKIGDLKAKHQASMIIADMEIALSAEDKDAGRSFLSDMKRLLQKLQSVIDYEEQGSLNKRKPLELLHPSDVGRRSVLRTPGPGSETDTANSSKLLQHRSGSLFQQAEKVSLQCLKQVCKTQHVKQPSHNSEIAKIAWSGDNAMVCIKNKGDAVPAKGSKKPAQKKEANEGRPATQEPQQHLNKTTVLIKDRAYQDQTSQYPQDPVENKSEERTSTTQDNTSGKPPDKSNIKSDDRPASKNSMILNYLAEGQVSELVSLGSNKAFFLMSLYNAETRCVELQSVNLKAKKYKRVFDVKQLTCDQTVKVGQFETRLLQTYLTVAPFSNDPRVQQRASMDLETAGLQRYQTLFTINSTKFIYMIIEQKEHWFEEQIKQENLYVNEIGRGASELTAAEPHNSIIHMSFDLDLADSFIVMSKVGEQGHLQVFLGSENQLGRATIDKEFERMAFNLKEPGCEGIYSHVEYMSSSRSFLVMGIFAERVGTGSKDFKYYFCCRHMFFDCRTSAKGRKSTEIVLIQSFRQELPSSLSVSGKLFEVSASKQLQDRYQFVVLIKNTSILLRLTLTRPENPPGPAAAHHSARFEQIDLLEMLGDLELSTEGEKLEVSAIARKPDEDGKYLIAYGNKYCEVKLGDN